MKTAEQAFQEKYKRLKNGKYEYTPKLQVMFSENIEKEFQKASDELKKESDK